MQKVEGYVEKIVFRNEENGYTVLFLTNPGEDDSVCCVGSLSYVAEGQYLVIEGEKTNHKNYGEQIKILSYEEKQPEDAVAIERYLGSGAIKGIGKSLAGRIVKKFGEDSFQIIEEEPERLAEVKGISMKMAINIAQQFHEKQEMRQAMIFMQNYGISMNMAVKIYKRYKQQIYEVLQKNPYRLTEDISGIGFKIADEIAQKMGFQNDSSFRVQAGILYALQQSGQQGNCYLPEKVLGAQATSLLQIDEKVIEHEMEEMLLNKQMICRENQGIRCLYSSTLYYMEMNCARMLLDLNESFPVDEKVLEKKIRRIEKEENITLEENQKNAVKQAVENGVLIIMGGPGTGKTTIINAITSILEDEGLTVLLAAPTGRAAKRMTETTGHEAQTIHRLLELNGNVEDSHEGMQFERNELQPLEADAIIIDEMSMVDIYLINALLRALVPGTRLIMVGDVNQLPSVGPGNVLRDMVKSQFCNVVLLNKIFRQAAESDIITNAHKINAGEEIKMDNKSKEFFCLERKDVTSIQNVIIELIMKLLPPYVKATPYDIQVLTPMRKGELGIENLNLILQRYMNAASPEKKEHEFHGVLFRENDKIMQIKNNYQIHWKKKGNFGNIIEEGDGVFNGDCGVIRSISTFSESVEIEFDEGKIVEYEFSEMDEIELAYAITIHKSQGSEYPAVILPLLGGPKMLMNRNLLYTAVTRAKECVTIVGSSYTVHQMIQNANEQKRYSSLAQRICELGVLDTALD